MTWFHVAQKVKLWISGLAFVRSRLPDLRGSTASDVGSGIGVSDRSIYPLGTPDYIRSHDSPEFTAKPGRAGHEKGDGKYVLSRSPDYMLMGNVAVLPYPVDKERMAKKLVRKSEHELWAEQRFHDTYELVCFQLSDTGVFRYFTFFKRKDSILKVKEAENEACKGLE